MIKHKLGKMIIFFFFALLFISCNKSTPKGVFKEFDLRSKIPSEIAAISNEQTSESFKEVSVGEPGAKVLIKWKTVKKDNSYYTLFATIELHEKTSGVQLTSASVQDPVNYGTEGNIVQSNIILINWDSSKTGRTKTGTFSATIKANGEFSVL